MIRPSMDSILPLSGLALAALLPLGGCHVTTHTQPVGTTTAAGPSITVQSPEVAEGVTLMETACDPSYVEECNGIDDNCDGRIDEGCGYSSGQIQITLAWGSGADLDLYVTDPAGETIFYNHTESASGGVLDHDARGNCRTDQSDNMVENVFWQQENPTSGTYTVEVHFWKGSNGCSAGAGPTDAILSIAVGGEVIGAYNVPALEANQRVTVATFTVP